MSQYINLSYLINSVLFSVLGLIIFTFGFWFIDKLTPYHLWKELIEERNQALAIVVGAVSIGICLIISSAIHS